MDSTNPSKRPLQEKCESSDRISNLPSSVLGLILSYLPTKDAVATSVLSTRWKSIFPTHVPLNELVFDDTYTFTPRPQPPSPSPSPPPSPSQSQSPSTSQPRPHTLSDVFFDFVDKLLNVTLRDVPSVEKIFIKWGVERSDYCNYSDDKIASWVSAAIRLKVRHLVLIASMLDSRVLFENLLNGYTTLVELEWGIRNLWFIIPNKFRLPNLKKLTLNAVILRHKSHLNELLDCCPVLVELRLISCEYLQYIRNRTIKKLFIVGGAYCETGVGIDAPSLEAFGYEGEGEILAKYAMRNTGSLHSVCVGFDCLGAKTTENLRLADLFIAWSRIKNFCLYGNAMKALYGSSVPLPEFINLTCLAIGCLGIGRCGWGMLDKFLDKAPNLTKLTFEEGLCSKHSLVPLTCFSIGLNIKKIEIWKFKCRSNEIKLIEYLFQIGSELQELILHCLPHENTSDLVKLSMLPKSSNACKVLLKDRKDWEKSRYSRDTWF